MWARLGHQSLRGRPICDPHGVNALDAFSDPRSFRPDRPTDWLLVRCWRFSREQRRAEKPSIPATASAQWCQVDYEQPTQAGNLQCEKVLYLDGRKCSCRGWLWWESRCCGSFDWSKDLWDRLTYRFNWWRYVYNTSSGKNLTRQKYHTFAVLYRLSLPVRGHHIRVLPALFEYRCRHLQSDTWRPFKNRSRRRRHFWRNFDARKWARWGSAAAASDWDGEGAAADGRAQTERRGGGGGGGHSSDLWRIKVDRVNQRYLKDHRLCQGAWE